MQIISTLLIALAMFLIVTFNYVKNHHRIVVDDENYYCNIFVSSVDENIDSFIVEGTHIESPNHLNFCAYLGIPYAKPPIRKLRFQVSFLKLDSINVIHSLYN